MRRRLERRAGRCQSIPLFVLAYLIAWGAAPLGRAGLKPTGPGEEGCVASVRLPSAGRGMWWQGPLIQFGMVSAVGPDRSGTTALEAFRRPRWWPLGGGTPGTSATGGPTPALLGKRADGSPYRILLREGWWKGVTHARRRRCFRSRAFGGPRSAAREWR